MIEHTPNTRESKINIAACIQRTDAEHHVLPSKVALPDCPLEETLSALEPQFWKKKIDAQCETILPKMATNGKVPDLVLKINIHSLLWRSIDGMVSPPS